MDTSPPPSKPRPQPVTRERMYELVWQQPMLRIGEHFGVSSSYLARICRQMNVPRPERGHWAKLAAGKRVREQPALPELGPGDLTVWSPGGGAAASEPPLPKAPARQTKRRSPGAPPASVHELVRGAKELFEAGRLSYECGYLKPSKRRLVDICVTAACLDKALGFANALFLAFEARRHHVMLEPRDEQFQREPFDEREKPDGNHYNNLWSPARPTVVYIGTVAFGLTLFEISENVPARYVNGEYVRESDYVAPKRKHAVDRTWTAMHDFPTNRLCLQAFSPYSGTKWVRQWHERTDKSLSVQISKIVKALENAASELVQLVAEARSQAALEHQRWEAQVEQWRQEEVQRKTVEALKQSKSDLHSVIARWTEVRNIEQFFADAQLSAEQRPEPDRTRVLERIALGRQLIGSSDALGFLLHWRTPDEIYSPGLP